MTKRRFLPGRFRPALPFRLPLFLSIFLCLALCANAQEREESFAATREVTASGLIEAVVLEVEGTSLKIAGGIAIDISRAVIISIGGGRLDIAIKPGMTIRANIGGYDDASSTYTAEIVRVHPEDRIIFSGVLQGADLANGHITILNRRILITGETSIVAGFKQKKIRAGLPVSVIARPSGPDLIALDIFPKIVLPTLFP